MGCFLGCFRVKEDDNRRCQMFSKLYSWKNKDPVIDRNQYAVVSSEERSVGSEKAEREVFEENFDEKLRQEAKFLKTCGAILETPIEIRKASVQQSASSDPCSIMINWDQPLEKSDDLPTKDPDTLIFKEEKLKSCKLEENNDTKKKIVRFKELNTVATDISPETENQMQPHGFESPYPTPLNLVDGMQTPGTMYQHKSENYRTGGIRAQFVYPVSDFSRRPFELNVSCEDGCENTSRPHSDRSPDQDRPIIGAAAAHWIDEEEAHSRVSPKQWDGNGIPNSTTKYKEDQRVSWHATPFEVRLEKALSDEKVYPPRKLDGRLVGLEDEQSVM